MKKLLCILIFITGCANHTVFSIKTVNDMGAVPPKTKTITVMSTKNDVYATRNKKFFEEIFKQSGWTIKEDAANANYTALFDTEHTSWQTTGTVPRYGDTSINSINTMHYGYSSSTRVNYNYGIVGYDTVINNHYRTCFRLAVYKMKSGKVGDQVYISGMCADEHIPDELLSEYIRQIYPFYAESVTSIRCGQAENGNVFCQP